MSPEGPAPVRSANTHSRDRGEDRKEFLATYHERKSNISLGSIRLQGADRRWRVVAHLLQGKRQTVEVAVLEGVQEELQKRRQKSSTEACVDTWS